MRSWISAAVLLFVGAGCSSTTEIEVDVTAAMPLALQAFSASFMLSGPTVDKQKSLTLGAVAVPVTVRTVLPDAAATLVVSASGLDTQGATWSGTTSQATVPHHVAHVTLTLTPGPVGGGDGGTNLGDGGAAQVWRQVASTGPAGRNSARMVYDTARKVMVLFGGVTTSGDSSETWEWNGSAWSLRTPAHAPTPRHGYAMAYDQMRGVTFLFSGAVMGGGPTTDPKVWKWDGTDWTALTTNTPPAPRTSSMMVYDSMRHVSVLFGGVTAPGVTSPETWEFDGANWNKPTLQGTPPPAQRAHAMVYDAAHHEVVLFGGAGPVATTFTYDGTAWTPRALQSSPPARRAAAMAYDSLRGVTVLFGGNESQMQPGRATIGDTWEWDGVATSWVERATTGPPARCSAAMAFDPLRGEALLFGGNVDGNNGGPPTNPLGDTWSR